MIVPTTEAAFNFEQNNHSRSLPPLKTLGAKGAAKVILTSHQKYTVNPNPVKSKECFLVDLNTPGSANFWHLKYQKFLSWKLLAMPLEHVSVIGE